MDEAFRSGLSRYFSESQLERLANCRVGVAGLGGLGSNIAMLLARSGLQNFLLLDNDVVEWSNLNRQHYFPKHVGLKKTVALSGILRELNPGLDIETCDLRVTGTELPQILVNCPVWVEAFDDAKLKAGFVAAAARQCKFFVCASGICGIGGEPITKKIFKNFHLVGDGQTGMDSENPYAPRVVQAAAMMADSVLEYLLGENAG